MDDVVRDTAQQEPADGAASVRADHDEVRTFRFRGSDDAWSGVALPDQKTRLGAGCPGLVHDALGITGTGSASFRAGAPPVAGLGARLGSR